MSNLAEHLPLCENRMVSAPGLSLAKLVLELAVVPVASKPGWLPHVPRGFVAGLRYLLLRCEMMMCKNFWVPPDDWLPDLCLLLPATCDFGILCRGIR